MPERRFCMQNIHTSHDQRRSRKAANWEVPVELRRSRERNRGGVEDGHARPLINRGERGAWSHDNQISQKEKKMEGRRNVGVAQCAWRYPPEILIHKYLSEYLGWILRLWKLKTRAGADVWLPYSRGGNCSTPVYMPRGHFLFVFPKKVTIPFTTFLPSLGAYEQGQAGSKMAGLK